MVKLVQQQKGDTMADLSKIQDDTPPEERERRMLELQEQWRERQEKSDKQAMSHLSEQMHASVQKEARLDRIEDKLDRILSILEGGK